MHFFFYGTLMAGSDNLVCERIHARLLALGPAIARGRLFAVPASQGWYPAFLPESEGGEVHGMAYAALPEWTEENLALLDAYEVYYPDHPEASEYLREPIDIICGGTAARADAYVYRAALPADAVSVPDGDFRAFLAGTGSAPYRMSAEEIEGLHSRLHRP